MDPRAGRDHFSVVMEKMIRELRGIPCLTFDEVPAPRQQIMVSRSFGAPVTIGRELAEAVSEYASRAAIKLRAQASLASQVHVFVSTSPFRKGDKQYNAGITVPLVRPSADTTTIVNSAVTGLRAIYRTGFKYAKAGVMLLDIQSDKIEQGVLDFGEEVGIPVHRAPSAALGRALDFINERYGNKTISVASAGSHKAKRTWDVRQERRTPRYTTRWDEMPIVRA
jgi:DNA polymerase V